MHELEKIEAAAARLMDEGRRGLLALVVGTQGSTYRRAGARSVIDADGNITGAISGGCLERDLAARLSSWPADDYTPRLIAYDSTDFDDVIFGLGLGCRGKVDVLVQPFDAAHPPRLPKLGRETSLFATALASGEDFPATGHYDRTTRLLIEGKDVLVEVIRPQRAVVVFGGGSDAEPVAALARSVGWRAEMVTAKSCHPDDLATKVDLTQFDAAVVMTHNFLYDLSLLEAVLPSAIPYVGLLGPKSRGEELLERLADVTPEMRARLHTPIGLDLGADAPEEIALAIVAEIQAALSEATATPLREKDTPIHVTPA